MSFVISHPDIEGTATIAERALPTYAAKGWVLEDRTDADSPTARPELEKPNRSDSAARWKTYAVATGMAFEAAMAATRDELADTYSPAPAGEPKRPQKNDSTESWRTYAVATGMSPDEAAAMGRDEIVAHFENQES